MNIAQASNNNCVLRGISTMRLALGYSEALPSGKWNSGGREVCAIISSLGKLFPKRKVKVWCKKGQAAKSTIPKNVEYMGDHYGRDDDIDPYLWAFAYGSPGSDTSSIEDSTDNPHSHFVIGYPTVYSGMSLSLLIAIKI